MTYQSEDYRQVKMVMWFRNNYNHLARSFYHIPNGGNRNVVEAKKLKQMGVLAGVWDMHLCVPSKGYSGLYIEAKDDNGQLTDAQKAFRAANEQWHKFAVARNLEDFIKIIKDYLDS